MQCNMCDVITTKMKRLSINLSVKICVNVLLCEYLWAAICGNVGGTFVGSGDLRRNGDGFGL